MEKKQIYYAIGGLMTVLTGYFIYDLIKGNQETKQAKVDMQKTIPSGSLSSEESSSVAKKDSNDSYPMKVGASGAKVVVLQFALNALGASLETDGKFGHLTYDAVQNVSGGFGGLNFLCGIDYGCSLTYNNWKNIIEKAKIKGFNENNAWTMAKKNWNL